MQWMAWTGPTAALFAILIGLIVAMLVWELISPTVARRGFLPMPTTRGDRLFVSLLATAFILMAWLASTTWSPWGALALSVAVGAVIGRWG
jgi:predicted small integral membrane protein